MKYLLILFLGYLAYRIVRPVLPPRIDSRSGKKEGDADSSYHIPEEDIRDADFQDIDED